MNLSGEAEPAGRNFLQYWRWRPNTWIVGEPFYQSPSNQFARRGVQPGDTLWIVSLNEQRRLVLLAPLAIEFLSPRREAERLLGRRDLYDADLYAINQRSPSPMRRVDIMDLAATLRFTGKADRLSISRNRIDGTQIQTLRELTPDSVVRLRERWGIVVAAAEIEHRTRPVPMTQNEMRLQNFGTPAERVVEDHLTDHGFTVKWTGDQLGLGYDLIATQDRLRLFVEVKSSFGVCTPTLTESEWQAAQQHGAAFVLALVDHVGKASEHLWYVRNPAATLTPARVSAFRFRRGALTDLLVSTP